MPWWVQSFPSVGRIWPSVSDLERNTQVIFEHVSQISFQDRKDTRKVCKQIVC